MNRLGTYSLSILLIGSFLLMAVLGLFPSQVTGVAFQQVVLPSYVPQPWQLAYDGFRYIYMAGTNSSGGFLIRIDTTTVFALPSISVKGFSVAPTTATCTCTNAGSALAVTNGIAYGNGKVYISSQYTGADTGNDLLTVFDTSTNSIVQIWLNQFRNSRTVKYDGGIVWIAGTLWSNSLGYVVPGLVKYDTSTSTISYLTLKMAGAPYDLLTTSSYVYVGGSNLARFNKVASQVDLNITTSSNPTFMAFDGSGNLWFTMNQAHKVGKYSTGGVESETAIPSWPTCSGSPCDGPYGLGFGASGLWLAGYQAKEYLLWNTLTNTVSSTSTVSNAPFYIVPGSLGTAWSWGQGSVDVAQLDSEAQSFTFPAKTISDPVSFPAQTVTGLGTITQTLIIPQITATEIANGQTKLVTVPGLTTYQTITVSTSSTSSSSSSSSTTKTTSSTSSTSTSADVVCEICEPHGGSYAETYLLPGFSLLTMMSILFYVWFARKIEWKRHHRIIS